MNKRIPVSETKQGFTEMDPSGRYGRFKDVLGKGAVKTVYKAFDKVLGMEVAWNQVTINSSFRTSEDLERLYCEVHLLKNLKHSSIIKFYASWIDIDRRTFNFITELFTSGTLREYRQKYRQVDIRAVKIWSRQILSGLTFLHDRDPPVIHRDLKCDNIFVNGHLMQVKIGDLGLAAILNGSKQAHTVIGTPEFMAPELYEENYDELVDIYSFGMCVLEMLTSEYPYSECSNPAQIYKKVTSGRLPDAFYKITDLEARDFVGKCLQKASNRLPARELLKEPFLATENIVSEAIFASPREAERLLLYASGVPDMTITGTMNPEEDTIFLKVKISDKDGHKRNIHFPFDINKDTVIDVAIEMVKELEITHMEPQEIAGMIDYEITNLLPSWKEKEASGISHHHSFNFEEESSEKNSFQDSISSFSSLSLGNSANEAQRPPEKSAAEKGKEAVQHRTFPESNRQRKLKKIRTMIDIKSQLLNQPLFEQLMRKQFKTVAAVENIGYRPPAEKGGKKRNQ